MRIAFAFTFEWLNFCFSLSQSAHTDARVFVFTCEMATPTPTSRALVEVRYVCIFLYFDARDGRFDRLT